MKTPRHRDAQTPKRCPHHRFKLTFLITFHSPNETTHQFQIKQDRFTTCFKNLWNNPRWVLAQQKKKSAAVKPVTKYVTKPVTRPVNKTSGKRKGLIWSDFYAVWIVVPGFGGEGVNFWGQKIKILTLKKIAPKPEKKGEKKLKFSKNLNEQTLKAIVKRERRTLNNEKVDEQNWPGKFFYRVVRKGKLPSRSELFLFCSFLGALLGGGGGMGGGTQKWIQDLCSTGKKKPQSLTVLTTVNTSQGAFINDVHNFDPKLTPLPPLWY